MQTIKGRYLAPNLDNLPNCNNTAPQLLTERRVAERLAVSVACLRRWRMVGQGPRYVKVGSLVRYRPEDLNNWISSRATGGDHDSCS